MNEYDKKIIRRNQEKNRRMNMTKKRPGGIKKRTDERT